MANKTGWSLEIHYHCNCMLPTLWPMKDEPNSLKMMFTVPFFPSMTFTYKRWVLVFFSSPQKSESRMSCLSSIDPWRFSSVILGICTLWEMKQRWEEVMQKGIHEKKKNLIHDLSREFFPTQPERRLKCTKEQNIQESCRKYRAKRSSACSFVSSLSSLLALHSLLCLLTLLRSFVCSLVFSLPSL